MKTLLFTTIAPADAAGNAVLLPSSSFICPNITSATTLKLDFKKINGTHDQTQVELTFTSGEGFEAIKAVLATIGGNPKSNIVDVVDIANRALMADTNSLFTAVAITA